MSSIYFKGNCRTLGSRVSQNILFPNIVIIFALILSFGIDAKGYGSEISPKHTAGISYNENVSKNISNSSNTREDLNKIHKTFIHTEAYKDRRDLGPHVNFKITPPEKRGMRGRVLVEVYNFSKVHFALMSFWIILSNTWGDRIEVEITCDDLLGGWSALKWVKIPGNGKIPEITKVQILNFKAFDARGKEIKIKYTTDLIKK